MFKLERITTFLKVIETNSFSKTAENLCISVAAVSKQIQALETELGFQLIKRTTRSLLLTERGHAYFEQCKRLIAEVEATKEFGSSLQMEPHGVLKAFIVHYFAEKYIIPHLKEFTNLYPKIKLDLEFGERMPNPKDESIDLIFGVSVPGPESWIQKKLSETRYVFCASHGYLKKWGVPKKPRDLSQHKYIQHKIRRPENALEFANEESIYISPTLRMNDTRGMLACAINGLGIVQLHHYVVATDLASKRLYEVLEKFSKSRVPIYLYYRPSRFPQPQTRAFIDFFSKKITRV